jgi:alpha-L-rhamnosidase
LSYQDRTTVERLRCENIARPLGLGERSPRLSWLLCSDAVGVRQRAYRVHVAESPGQLARRQPLWDTGRVSSGEQAVIYAGPPLVSRRRYWWSVQVWEQDEPTGWAEPAWFEMGLLTSSDWQAQWIGSAQQPIADDAQFRAYLRPEDVTLPQILARTQSALVEHGIPPVRHELMNPAPMFRREFVLRGPVHSGRAYVTAHGVYRMEINGQRVADTELAPDWTSYDKYLMYQPYDITGLLAVGPNAVGVTVADGWYAGHLGLTGSNRNYGDRLALLLQLEITLADGTTVVVGSDETFRWSTGPYEYADLLVGERYDARLEQPGWSAPGFDDSSWLPAQARDARMDTLIAQVGEPVRVIERRPAQRILTTPSGRTLVDFGECVAGRVRMTAAGPAGTQIVLRHGETLDEDGELFNSVFGYNNENRDVYILNGRGEQTHEPAFTFHGFRYAEVTGYPGTPEPADFELAVLGSDLEQTAAFECSDSRVNRLFNNVRRTFRANSLSVVTDNPDRERAGWTGDLEIVAPSLLAMADYSTFLQRWLSNLMLEQKDDGQVPLVIPWFDGYGRGVELVSSAGWSDACVIVPWLMYQRYGDTRVLERCYPSMVRWLDFVASSAREHIPAEHRADPDMAHVWWPSSFHFGDWLTPSVTRVTPEGLYGIESGYSTLEMSTTMYYARTADLMARISGVIGRPDMRARYTELTAAIRRGFAKAFIGPDGLLTTPLQGMYVLALEFGVVPDELRPRFVRRLTELIRANGDRLDTGFSSTAFILPLLCAHGHTELAYTLLLQNENPSWLYAVERDATSVWELWDSIQASGAPTRTSYIQPGFGTVAGWLLSDVAGLDCVEPGGRRLRIEPRLDARMDYARAECVYRHGRASVNWRHDGDRLVLDVVIPPNCVADVLLPGGTEEITVSATRLDSSAGVMNSRARGGQARFELGSGRYSITAPWRTGTKEAGMRRGMRKEASAC